MLTIHRPDANLPRANKRFLTAIIRSTDDHNKAVLRAQTEAAQDARAERIEEERKERRARASEAGAERLRRLMGGASRRRDDHNNWNSDRRRHRRSRSRSAEKLSNENEKYERSRRGKSRHPRRSESPRRTDDKGEGGSSRRQRTLDGDNQSRKRTPSISSQTRRSPSPLRSKTRSRNSDANGDSIHSDREKRKQPKSPSRSSKKVSQKDELPVALTESRSSHSSQPPEAAVANDLTDRVREASENSSQHEPGPARSRPQRRKEPASPTLSEEEDIERLRPRRRPRTEKVPVNADRSSPGTVASKMDKYFDASYDPRLDIEPMTVPTVPATGLIEGTEFEGWEAMLDIIRQRREDKLERKRLERQGLLIEKGSSKKIVIKGEMASSSAWKGEGTSMMDIQYSKRGSVREWDMGKQGF